MHLPLIGYTRSGDYVVSFEHLKIVLAPIMGKYEVFRLLNVSEQYTATETGQTMEIGPDSAKLFECDKPIQRLRELNTVRTYRIEVLGEYWEYCYLYRMDLDDHYAASKAMDSKLALEIQVDNRKALERKLDNLTSLILSGEKITAKTTDGMLAQWDRIVEKRKQAAEKERQAKIKLNKASLQAKLAEGFTHIGVHRNWTGTAKHPKFQGETIEFYKERPKTRQSYELTLATVDTLAETILKY